MKKIGDLEGDQRALAQGDAGAVGQAGGGDRTSACAGQMDELDQKGEREGRDAAAEAGRRSRPATPRERRWPRSWSGRATARGSCGGCSCERDLAEAKGEAERAAASLERADRAPGRMADARRASAANADPETDKCAEAVAEARALAQEIADDLAQAAAQGRRDVVARRSARRARGQAERQGAIGERTEDDRAARRCGAWARCRAWSKRRGRAERRRRAACARRASMLRQRRIQAERPPRSATRPNGWPSCAIRCRSARWAAASQPRDPVRIPGADESSAPRAWRQELLDAMKEKAPERFRDEVRRYYEELVR